ncbi:SRPBCC family protein [Streptomyces sp. NPDC003691]
MNQQVSVSLEIGVPPELVYATVTNVADMGRWSPECTGADLAEAPAAIRPGTGFTGHNDSGRRPWSTRCRVTAADPGERFSFLVRALGLRVSIWSYRLEPLDSGRRTRVTETWTDQRGPLMLWIGRQVSGVQDRAEYNRASMETTLERLKEFLEEEQQRAA